MNQWIEIQSNFPNKKTWLQNFEDYYNKQHNVQSLPGKYGKTKDWSIATLFYCKITKTAWLISRCFSWKLYISSMKVFINLKVGLGKMVLLCIYYSYIIFEHITWRIFNSVELSNKAKVSMGMIYKTRMTTSISSEQ